MLNTIRMDLRKKKKKKSSQIIDSIRLYCRFIKIISNPIIG